MVNTPEQGAGGWESLEGQIIGNIAIGRHWDLRLELFVRGSDNALWHNSQIAHRGSWGGWTSLGGQIASDPTVIPSANDDGRLEVFARGSNGEVWHISQTAPGGSWGPWASRQGQILGNVTGIRQGDRLELFVRGADSALWRLSRTAAGWDSAWTSLGGQIVSDPTLTGVREVMARGSDNAIWYIGLTAGSGSGGSWTSLGPPTLASPYVGNIVAGYGLGKRAIIVRRLDNQVESLFSTEPEGRWGNRWERLWGAQITSDPAILDNSPMVVFARGIDNAVWYIRQNAFDGSWGIWKSLEGQVTGNVAGIIDVNRFELFVHGADNAVWHKSLPVAAQSI